ncbi:hypothetical protein P3T24_006262 [Paraburkholderia sp. GAS33]
MRRIVPESAAACHFEMYLWLAALRTVRRPAYVTKTRSAIISAAIDIVTGY